MWQYSQVVASLKMSSERISPILMATQLVPMRVGCYKGEVGDFLVSGFLS